MFRHCALLLMVMAFTIGELPSYASAATDAPPAPSRARQAPSVSTDACRSFALLPPFALPEGRLGTAYRRQFSISDHMRTPRYTVVKGRLPDGLKMDSRGRVTGVPRKPGRYRFTIRAELNCATHANRDEAAYTLVVRPPVIVLSVQTQPETLKVVAGKDVVYPIRYLLRSNSADGIKLLSSGGRFMADRRKLGRTARPMTVIVKGAGTWANELLTIRGSVTDAALRARKPNLTYVRDFTSNDAAIGLQARIPITVSPDPGALNRRPGSDADSPKLPGSAPEVMRQPENQTPAPSVLPGQIVVTAEASPIGSEVIQRLAKTYALTTIESFELRALNQIVTVFTTPENVTRLVKMVRRERGVIHAQPNRLFHTYADPQDDLQPIYHELNLAGLHRYCQGEGVRVAIIDTGVDLRHPDLKNRIVQYANLMPNTPYRAELHGTAMAGVVAAGINGYGISGIAPRADLIALRACRQTSEDHPQGRCTSVSVSKALDLAIASKARVVNMSFGTAAPDPLMMQLLDAGAQKSILFVAPVGNRRSSEDIPFPASHTKVLAVGGIDAQGQAFPNDALNAAANVCAPAGNVLTTIPGGGHNFISGTSVSAAIVTGMLAVAKEKNRYLNIDALPGYHGDICRWQERLINQALCNAGHLEENDK